MPGREAREFTRDPKAVMVDFHLFALGDGPLRSGRPVTLTYPAAFDAIWVVWYSDAFASGDPFQCRFIVLKTLAMQLLGRILRPSVSEAQHAGDLVLRTAVQPRSPSRTPSCKGSSS